MNHSKKMKTQPSNYCRNMVLQFEKTLELKNSLRTSQPHFGLAMELAAQAKKFLLPPGGRLFDDKEFKALDDSEQLRLPFPVIALEFAQPIINAQDALVGMTLKSSKRIVFVVENDNWLTLLVVCWIDDQKSWVPFPCMASIPTTGYLDRTVKDADGRTPIRVKLENENMPVEDFADELGSLLCFLNSLQCANVNIEHPVSNKSGKKIKASLPFDSYHYLTIARQSGPGSGQADATGQTGGHRSPREHLRRGHIRRLEDRRIWVNAVVVNAGSAGSVAKSYIVGK